MSRFKPYNPSCPPLYGIRNKRAQPATPRVTESGSFPAIERDRPRPGVDYPEDAADLERMFPAEVDIHRYLERIRYPRGFACAACGDRAAPWRSGTGLLACRACRHPAPLRAGTLFQASPAPLRRWLNALWLVTASEASVTASDFAETLGVESGEAACHLRRIRNAMALADAPPLEGHVYVATSRLAQENGRPSASSPLIAMAIDVERVQHPRIRLRQLPRVTSREIQRFVVDAVAPCSKVVTAAWRGFSLITDSGYEHEVRDQMPSMANAKGALGPREVWALMRLWVWSTPELDERDLQPALDEFSFRFNRRHYRPGQLFYRLMRLVTELDDSSPAGARVQRAAS